MRILDDFRCFFMEESEIVAHAAHNLIKEGMDYTDPFLLYESMKQV